MEFFKEIAEFALIISVSMFSFGCAGILFLSILDEIKWKNRKS